MSDGMTDMQRDKDNIEQLRIAKQESYQKLQSLHTKLSKVNLAKAKLDDEFNSQRQVYIALDKKLAMLDGRFKVVADKPKPEVGVSVENLSVDQIVSIAEELGVEIGG